MSLNCMIPNFKLFKILFFWQLSVTLIYCVGCELSILKTNGDKMPKVTQINAIIFFETEAAV